MEQGGYTNVSIINAALCETTQTPFRDSHFNVFLINCKITQITNISSIFSQPISWMHFVKHHCGFCSGILIFIEKNNKNDEKYVKTTCLLCINYFLHTLFHTNTPNYTCLEYNYNNCNNNICNNNCNYIFLTKSCRPSQLHHFIFPSHYFSI